MFSIIGLLTGLAGPITTIVNKILDLQAQKAQAKSNEDIKEIDAQIEALHDKRSVLIAEAGSRINAIIRAICSVGILSYPVKIFLFDKVIGSFLGHSSTHSMFDTDGLTTNDTWVMMTVLGFYFLGNIWPLKRS